MKKSVLLVALLCLTITFSWAQSRDSHDTPLIGSLVPSFTAESTNGQVTFPDDFGSKWKILFSHPQDFTPVCSSELLELAKMQDEFEQLGVKLIILSTDDLAMHKKWKESLETVKYQGNEPVKIKFPLVADADKKISEIYGMVHAPSGSSRDVRGVFIIDPNNVVQAVYFYPQSVGRNMEEIKRTVVALQTANNNVVTPANWQPGDDVLITYKDAGDLKEIKKDPDTYELTWYMVYKRMNSSVSER